MFMADKRRGKRGAGDERELIESAVEQGLSKLVRNHPMFRGSEAYMLKHIDLKAIGNVAREVYENLPDDLSDAERNERLYGEIVDYVSEAKAFDEHGKAVILEENLGGNIPWYKKGQMGDDVGVVIKAFDDLYQLMASGDYAQHMPEVAKDVYAVHNAGFFNAAIRVLYDRGLMTNEKYDILRHEVDEVMRGASSRVVENLGKYLGAYRGDRREENKKERRSMAAAAVILGVVGLGIFISSFLGITGGVVGSNNISLSNSIGGWISVIFLFVSFVLFFCFMRRNSKKYNKKSKKIIKKRKKE